MDSVHSQTPAWLSRACRELGQAELAGDADNPAILGYARRIGHPEVGHDEVAWCAAFVGACLEDAGTLSTRSMLARSYLEWGEALGEPRLGAVTVLSRAGDPALGHVGFLVGWTERLVLLLGGNQGNCVSVAEFPRARVLAFRWPAQGAEQVPAAQPATAATRTAAGPPPQDPDFAAALQFVLSREGGYGEDPYDPGGPTNQGITLADLAAQQNVRVDAGSFARLKQQLRTISPAVVHDIYRDRYWLAGHCQQLPPGVALMHFDAAVNQGLGRAARLLQQAVGAEADGEIGPGTLAATRATDAATVLHRYADLRRQHYRSLSHFWRFGRGWLARVDTALALALQLASAATAPTPLPAAMPTINPQRTEQKEISMDSQPKWWGQSLTIWGALTTVLTTVLPVIGPLLGINITADLIQQLGGQCVQLVQVLGGLIGTGMTIYGRLRASQPLERKPVNLRI